MKKKTIATLDFDKLNADLDNSSGDRTITSRSDTNSLPQHSEYSKASKQLQAVTTKYLDIDKNKKPSQRSNMKKKSNETKTTKTQPEAKSPAAKAEKPSMPMGLLDPLEEDSTQLFAQSFKNNSEIKGIQNRQLREMQREIERLRWKLANTDSVHEKKKPRLHVGYLYASPIIYEDYDPVSKKKGYQSLP